jgi:hypothetical protein
MSGTIEKSQASSLSPADIAAFERKVNILKAKKDIFMTKLQNEYDEGLKLRDNLIDERKIKEAKLQHAKCLLTERTIKTCKNEIHVVEEILMQLVRTKQQMETLELQREGGRLLKQANNGISASQISAMANRMQQQYSQTQLRLDQVDDINKEFTNMTLETAETLELEGEDEDEGGDNSGFDAYMEARLSAAALKLDLPNQQQQLGGGSSSSLQNQAVPITAEERMKRKIEQFMAAGDSTINKQ